MLMIKTLKRVKICCSLIYGIIYLLSPVLFLILLQLNLFKDCDNGTKHIKGLYHREKKDRVVMDFKKRAFSLKFYLCNLCKQHLLQTKIL